MIQIFMCITMPFIRVVQCKTFKNTKVKLFSVPKVGSNLECILIHLLF